MDTERTFKIGFEEDVMTLVENQGHYRSRSFFKPHEAGAQAELSGEPDYLVTETEISDSYMSAELSTIQRLDERRSLLILNLTCHPAPGRRFVNARVDWRFRSPPSPSPGSSPGAKSPSPSPSPFLGRLNPRIVVIAPQHSVGGWTEEQTRLMWSLALPLEVGFGGPSIGIEPSREKETQKAVMHAMSIVGSTRENMSRAFWTIEENKSSERGIPSHFQLAVAVEHNGPFVIELEIKAELGGGLWPTYMLSKKGKGGNGLRRLVDVDVWKSGEIEMEPGEKAWRSFLGGLTGEVSGVMREFEQTIVRP
ncbi:hypothetical protein BDZ94DRAFT_553614 [Collybia nuda]|uniref:Uncharacterized protein n=1 Tax=Collybia nuda TaxID=64659 RepID=A0A9P5YH79_9AGAR|nr:hypothetical protein BDZ94DRAFT_553614 [Collybia nuda]